MDKITFDNMPAALEQLMNKVDALAQRIEGYEPDDILTVDEACAFIGVKKQTIYGLVSQGKIPVSKRGKKLYFSKNELKQWLIEGRRK